LGIENVLVNNGRTWTDMDGHGRTWTDMDQRGHVGHLADMKRSDYARERG
jgi:hypothetical protein